MKLNCDVHINPDNLILQNVSEIVRKGFWVNNFHISVRQLC